MARLNFACSVLGKLMGIWKFGEEFNKEKINFSKAILDVIGYKRVFSRKHENLNKNHKNENSRNQHNSSIIHHFTDCIKIHSQKKMENLIKLYFKFNPEKS
jgi:hypothetical protein